ncbi:hypothetical protein [Niallia sp. Krafla_26]|uniref:hypothetical protein n=1 Tax=Niallia sp. Krafla_26 TaxID=3064703 RepID=UPI003D16EF2B
MKKKVWIACGLSLGLLLTGCGSGENEAASTETKQEIKSKSELGDYQIVLGGEIDEQDDKFVIEGKSNLIPGSRVVGELWVSKDELYTDTTELVEEDGSFTMELDHHQYGEATFVVRFDFESAQDDPIKRHYGERGQKLKGPYIYKHEVLGDINKKAEVSLTYHPDEETDLVFKEPQWEKRPEDYGEPRVWIEVDEITEDGEFYYLSGKSNLLEGAEIKGSFASNTEKTQIKPDGTFDLKIKYRYKENEDFEITFNPQYQWDEIQEAYGSEGQKLVGDLVVTNQYSKNQTIEKIIPWENE